MIKKNDLITSVASKTGQAKIVCESVIDALISAIKDCLIRGDKVFINNFMSFETVERAERKGRDLNTGAPVTFPSMKSIKCKMSKTFKDAVNEK